MPPDYYASQPHLQVHLTSVWKADRTPYLLNMPLFLAFLDRYASFPVSLPLPNPYLFTSLPLFLFSFGEAVDQTPNLPMHIHFSASFHPCLHPSLPFFASLPFLLPPFREAVDRTPKSKTFHAICISTPLPPFFPASVPRPSLFLFASLPLFLLPLREAVDRTPKSKP